MVHHFAICHAALSVRAGPVIGNMQAWTLIKSDVRRDEVFQTAARRNVRTATARSRRGVKSKRAYCEAMQSTPQCSHRSFATDVRKTINTPITLHIRPACGEPSLDHALARRSADILASRSGHGTLGREARKAPCRQESRPSDSIRFRIRFSLQQHRQ